MSAVESNVGGLKGTESPLLEAEACANVVMALTAVTAFSRTSAPTHYHLYRAV